LGHHHVLRYNSNTNSTASRLPNKTTSVYQRTSHQVSDTDMATKTLEARFEHLSVKDENEAAQNGSTMLKSKVFMR